MSIDPNQKFNLSELIKIAKANKDTIKSREPGTDTLDEVAQFVLTFRIKDGANKVFTQLIYKAYSNWSVNPMKRIPFSKQFAMLFDQKIGVSKKPYYELNYKPAQLLNAVERQRGRTNDTTK